MMKIKNQILLHTILLAVIVYFGALSSDANVYYIPVAYSQNKLYSFKQKLKH